MPGCLPARYRLLDLVFALFGTVAFLVDLGSDVWSAVWYYKAGDTGWAVLHIGLYVLSSAVLQILSWGWFWVDRQDLELELSKAPSNEGRSDGKENSTGGAAQICGDTDYVECYRLQASVNETSNGDMKHHNENGAKYPEDASHVTSVGTAVSVVDAVPTEKVAPGVCDQSNVHTETPRPVELATNPGCPGDIPAPDTQTDPTVEERSALCCGCTTYNAAGSDDELIVKRFFTSKIILWPSCFTLLHVLQLGYPLRCVHSLEVGLAAYRNPEDDLFKDYAYFLTHDISMMRLVETFLENTPQLILVLYIIIQREAIETFQWTRRHCLSASLAPS
ncbi:XK-related protein 8 isoform X2 [Rhinoderma darwinii]|uniref:XK-related protein 8 isoform X2 n=1 Tax=Rhinoderma darwinii TaxID=43563 RepID=UPI003F67DFC4